MNFLYTRERWTIEETKVVYSIKLYSQDPLLYIYIHFDCELHVEWNTCESQQKHAYYYLPLKTMKFFRWRRVIVCCRRFLFNFFVVIYPSNHSTHRMYSWKKQQKQQPSIVASLNKPNKHTKIGSIINCVDSVVFVHVWYNIPVKAAKQIWFFVHLRTCLCIII